MTLDYSWSHEPIFPAPIFEEPRIGPVLRKHGIELDHAGNHVRAFHNQETTLALMAAPPETINAVIDAGFSLAPHGMMRAPSPLPGRVSFLIEKITQVLDKAEAGEISDKDVGTHIWSMHLFLSRQVIRRVVVDEEKGRLTPDPELASITAGKSQAIFDHAAFREALEGGPHAPAKQDAPPAQAGKQKMMSLTTAVLFDEPAEVAELKDRVLASGQMEGFEINDLNPGSFTAEKDDIMIVAMGFEAPYPVEDLKHYCAGNALAQNAWEIASPTKGHVHIQLMRKDADRPTRDDVMLLAQIAVAMGGRAVIWSAAKAAMPMEHFARTVQDARGGSWPLMGMVRLTPYQQEDRNGVAIMGLQPFVDHELALAAGPDDSLGNVAGRLLSLAGWVLDTKPAFRDGDTLGVEGTGAAQLRIHEIKAPDGISTFELRPYDGPPAEHTPEDRAREEKSAETEASSPPDDPQVKAPAKRPFWKFWAK